MREKKEKELLHMESTLQELQQMTKKVKPEDRIQIDQKGLQKNLERERMVTETLQHMIDREKETM